MNAMVQSIWERFMASLESSPDSLSVIRGANADEAAAAKDDYGQSMFVDMYKFDTSGMRAGLVRRLALYCSWRYGFTLSDRDVYSGCTQLGSAQRASSVTQQFDQSAVRGAK